MSKRIFLTLIVVLIFAIGALPVVSMLRGSVTTDGGFSLQAYNELLTSSRQWRLMWHSVILASIVTAISVGVGAPLGLIFGKTDLPARKFLTALFIVPLVIPPYILAVSWLDLLGRDGLLMSIFGASAMDTANHLAFGLPGCVAVLSSIFLPIPMLTTLFLVRSINPGLEEAGRLVAGWRLVVAKITIPIILPGILISAMLVFILAFGEFSVPSVLRYDVFPLESFTQFSAFYNFRAATAAAVPLAGVTLLLLLAETALFRHSGGPLEATSDTNRPPAIKLGKWKWPLFVPITATGLSLGAAPILVLLCRSATPNAYADAFKRAGGSLLRSLGYAALGASLLAFIGFFLGYLISTKSMKCWRMVDSLTIFLLALPATVTGIGLVSLWNSPWTNFIYATPAIIILGYLAKYTALTSRISAAGLAGIPPSMEEAAMVAGAGWFRRMALIVAPLAKGSLLTAWLVGYIFALRDTGISIIVYPPGHETLPVKIMTLMANGSPQLIAALCVIMVAATLIPAAVLWTLSGISKGGLQ